MCAVAFSYGSLSGRAMSGENHSQFKLSHNCCNICKPNNVSPINRSNVYSYPPLESNVDLHDIQSVYSNFNSTHLIKSCTSIIWIISKSCNVVFSSREEMTENLLALTTTPEVSVGQNDFELRWEKMRMEIGIKATFFGLDVVGRDQKIKRRCDPRSHPLQRLMECTSTSYIYKDEDNRLNWKSATIAHIVVEERWGVEEYSPSSPAWLDGTTSTVLAPVPHGMLGDLISYHKTAGMEETWLHIPEM